MMYSMTQLSILFGLLLCFLDSVLSTLEIASSTSTIEYTPELIAIQDYFPGAQIINSGVPNLFSSSSINLASNAETQALVNYYSHQDLRIIYTVAEVYYRIIANKNAGISVLTDLKGKNIGTIPTTSAAYFVEKYLASVGLTALEYTVVSGSPCIAAPYGAGTFPYMLAQGQIAAVGMWEPTAELSSEALGSNAIIFQNRSIYRSIFNLHSTTENLSNPSTRASIVSFLQALNQVQGVYNSDPSSVWPTIASALGMSEAVLEAVWPIHTWPVNGTLPTDLLDVLVAEDQWVAQVDGRAAMTEADLTSLIDSSVQSEALLPSGTSVSSTSSTLSTSMISKFSTSTSTSTTTTSSIVTTSSAAPGATLPKWSQCAGEGWTGSGTCVAGTTCTYSNAWYSQCL